ncbi:MAG: hypothetical protein AAF617_15495 [Bacteroidota bacterium]
MKTLITLFITITVTFFTQAQETVSMSDFSNLDNTNWTGELMYVDYSDSSKVTLPTTLEIKVKKNKVVLYTKYPNEKSANGKSSLKLSKDGTHIGNQKITRVNRMADGSMEIETMYEGQDDNRDATMFITYFFTDSKLSMQKEVEFKDTPGKFVRNRYTYTKS